MTVIQGHDLLEFLYHSFCTLSMMGIHQVLIIKTAAKIVSRSSQNNNTDIIIFRSFMKKVSKLVTHLGSGQCQNNYHIFALYYSQDQITYISCQWSECWDEKLNGTVCTPIRYGIGVALQLCSIMEIMPKSLNRSLSKKAVWYGVNN